MAVPALAEDGSSRVTRCWGDRHIPNACCWGDRHIPGGRRREHWTGPRST